MGTTEELFAVTNGVEGNSDGDEDVCEDNAISSLFNLSYHIKNEVSVTLKKTYILHMDISPGESKKIVAGLSNSTCVVYDCETLSKLSCLRDHKKVISGVKVPLSSSNLIYTSSVDGTVKLWDLRAPQDRCESTFASAMGDDKLKPLLCFDVNRDNTYLVAGTELVEGDSFLLFWDVRSTKLLGGYWESHRDDVTAVSFHSAKRDWLTSGSVDGLINVYDIHEHEEDDAFMYCYNTMSSVGKLKWLSCACEDSISCITHTEDLLLWKIEDASPYCNYSRGELCTIMHRTFADYCYVVDAHETGKEGEQIVLCGSSSGHGACLRLLRAENGVLKPMALLLENKQIVRTSCYDDKNDLIVTGGNSGLISLWKLGSCTPQLESKLLKMKSRGSKDKEFNRNPY